MQVSIIASTRRVAALPILEASFCEPPFLDFACLLPLLRQGSVADSLGVFQPVDDSVHQVKKDKPGGDIQYRLHRDRVEERRKSDGRARRPGGIHGPDEFV